MILDNGNKWIMGAIYFIMRYIAFIPKLVSCLTFFFSSFQSKFQKIYLDYLFETHSYYYFSHSNKRIN